jgi:uncharacterized protein DUF6916
MSISRRIFIKAGTLTAIAAGISLKPALFVLAQGQIAPISDPLSNYTQATFEQYVNSIFTLRRFVTVEVVLEKVEDTLSPKVSRAGGRESFTLHFRGGGRALRQDTYVVDHPALGTFRLFLVPSGADENGAQGCVAVINRLAYTGTSPAPGGTQKPLVRKPSILTTSPEGKPAPKPTQTPVVKPSRKGNSSL